jgi:molybdate transport system substrate-binding protein
VRAGSPTPDIGTIDAFRQALLAAGDAAVAIQPVSELLSAPGVELVGPIPAELQFESVYSAAIVAGSTDMEASRRLIAFRSSARAAAATTKSGMVPSRR